MSHSQKNFSNFKNSYGGHNLGIVHKKVTTEKESERGEKESEQLEKELEPERVSEKLAEESERVEESGVSTSLNTSEAATSSVEVNGARSSAPEMSASALNNVGKPHCLVSYDMSTSDSDESSS